MKIKALHDARSNQTWMVRLVQPGDRYGRADKLVNTAMCSLVEFFDPKHPHTDLGQFVSRYHAATLASSDAVTRGLQLDGGTPQWSLSADCMRDLVTWLQAVVPDEILTPETCSLAA